MAFAPKDRLIYTNKFKEKMDYHNLYEEEVLLTFNYPDSTKKVSSFFEASKYESQRDFGKYKIFIVYAWDSKEKKNILITTWRLWKINWWSRSINWWTAHVLGR